MEIVVFNGIRGKSKENFSSSHDPVQAVQLNGNGKMGI